VPPTPPPPPPPAPAVDDKELQELRAKIRVLEAKREDDARRVRELETRYEEAERFVAVRPKLQAKLAQQQTDLIAARRELADAQQLAELAETRHLDSQEQLEMAALDKEVAEERAEAVELELEEVKERLASLEVELDVLKGGGGDHTLFMLSMGCSRGQTARWRRRRRSGDQGVTAVHSAREAERAAEGGTCAVGLPLTETVPKL
jgi:dynactin 1